MPEDRALSTTCTVQPDADREWIRFSPTSRFHFMSEGGPGVPEFFEERSARGDGAPLHRHPWPTWELVLSGTLRYRMGYEERIVRAGDVVYVAPGVTHAYVVESDEARVVGVGMSDGRFPRLQRAAAPLLTGPGGPDFGAVAGLAAQAGLEIQGPPLAPSGDRGDR